MALQGIFDIKWTQGHCDIAGNEKADHLAKAGAAEAKEMGEETSIVTVQDIKGCTSLSVILKWQDRWHIGGIGRDFHKYIS